MGFFSWSCNHCGKSILSPWATDEKTKWMHRCVAITENGMIIGVYDGYGRLDLIDSVGESVDIAFTKPQVYHYSCWLMAGGPTEYLGPSKRAEDQGYFIDRADYDIMDPLLKKAIRAYPGVQS